MSSLAETYQLSEDQLEEIVRIQVDKMMERLRNQGVEIEIDKKALKYLAKKGYDPAFGARPLKRLIQNEILDQAAILMLEKEERKTMKIKVKEKNGKLEVK